MGICQRIACLCININCGNMQMYTRFVNLEKVYDRVPRDELWAVLLEYDVRSLLLSAIKCTNSQKSVFVSMA